MDAINLSGDLVVRPEDVSSGAYILPAINGIYNYSVAPKGRGWDTGFSVGLTFQTPAITPSGSRVAGKRLLLTGGDGAADLAWKFEVGRVSRKLLFGARARGRAAWTSPKTETDADEYVSSTFGLLTANVDLYALLKVAYIGAQLQYLTPIGHSSSDIVASTVKNNMACIFLAALKLNMAGADQGHPTNYFLQFRVLAPFKELDSTTGSDASSVTVDFRLVAAFSPL
jgi:hypothetical protein